MCVCIKISFNNFDLHIIEYKNLTYFPAYN